ncbi:hypothetical protein GCM10022222_26810 [Amycolatopsis ultiminotia]|uniref:Uncharacterized protein n=1 Tax=Amycolatopsis ultiminotia TaxID=543629 RepID=A0ABP6VVY0_9PSEU
MSPDDVISLRQQGVDDVSRSEFTQFPRPWCAGYGTDLGGSAPHLRLTGESAWFLPGALRFADVRFDIRARATSPRRGHGRRVTWMIGSTRAPWPPSPIPWTQLRFRSDADDSP